MMSCVVFSLVVVTCRLFVASNADPATLSRINHVCAKSYDYYLCEDIFHQHLFTNITDFRGLTQIAIAQTLLFSSDTLISYQKSQRAEPDKTTRDLYAVCIEGYQVLLNQFEDAFLQFGKEDFKSMLFDMSGCERFVNDCDSVLGTKIADVKNKNHKTRVLVKMSNVSGELIGTNVL